MNGALHSHELLDIVWKKRRDANIRIYKPKLKIWIHSLDIQTIMVERRDLLELFGPREIWERSRFPTTLFGEDLIVSDDISIGKPVVEILE